jgi:hypothetical protein
VLTDHPFPSRVFPHNTQTSEGGRRSSRANAGGRAKAAEAAAKADKASAKAAKDAAAKKTTHSGDPAKPKPSTRASRPGVVSEAGGVPPPHGLSPLNNTQDTNLAKTSTQALPALSQGLAISDPYMNDINSQGQVKVFYSPNPPTPPCLPMHDVDPFFLPIAAQLFQTRRRDGLHGRAFVHGPAPVPGMGRLAW